MSTQLKIGMRALVNSHDWTYCVTIAFNRDGMSLDAGRSTLKNWQCRMNRRMYGQRWMKKETTFFVAFPEHIGTNLHYHILIKVPNQQNKMRTVLAVEDALKTICPSGTYDIQEPTKENIEYAMKDTYKQINFNNFIVSSEFKN